MNRKRLVVGITGSSGVILGVRLLEVLRELDVESHLILSHAARITLAHETDRTVAGVQALADVAYQPEDLAAPLASGSFATDGMVILPCSIKTLSAVANCFAADLMARAADVTLKEGRPLLLGVRETPLHPGHIRLMAQAAEAGAIIFPPVPAYYTHSDSVAAQVDNLVGRVLSRMGIPNQFYGVWGQHD
jgi:4-hydroxy-3-polyprenylbenzoate decarboxylase